MAHLSEMRDYSLTKTYPWKADQAGFLLGGIGTGNFTIGSRGELRDWELFNQPGKGNVLPYTFFCIRTETERETKMRILEAGFTPPYRSSHGIAPEETGGLPRFTSAEMASQYPFVQVRLSHESLPIKVTMEGFTPFIPLDADNSAIPGAVIRFKVCNTGPEVLKVSTVCSLANAVGFEGYNIWGRMEIPVPGKNSYRREGDKGGLFYTAPGLEEDHLTQGSMSLISPDEGLFYKEEWLNSGWWDGLQDFWDDLAEDGRLEVRSQPPPPGNEDTREENLKIGSLGSMKVLQPGQEETFTFLLSWYFPNRPATWGNCREGVGMVRNYYARLFENAWEVGRYLMDNLEWLEGRSSEFSRALYSSTLPEYVLQAVANNITVIRSTTCFRIDDGTFFAWEGCFAGRGCCEGSCNHVWNYAQTLAFLFPQLDRTMLEVEFLLETDDTGRMPHRFVRKLNNERKNEYQPAVDGQLGAIIRLYRYWTINGDDIFIKDLWPRASLVMDYALKTWDEDGDGVLDAEQYVTYDIEFYGPNSLTASLLLTALKAMVRMAAIVGDSEGEMEYQRMYEKSSAKAQELLWNGQYYAQKIQDMNQWKYQFGQGCLADQLLGQFFAHICGLGYILPEENVKKALSSLVKNNFVSSFWEFENTQRTYALNEEKGLVLCTWPHGERPRFPFVYANEVWTGVEYQVAAHLLFEGFLEEGLMLLRAVRSRYDGYKRNPWNETECGNHYVRSMASWALLPAITGFRYDVQQKTVRFNPLMDREDFRCFWITGKAWGVYRQERDAVTKERKTELQVLYGDREVSLEG